MKRNAILLFLLAVVLSWSIICGTADANSTVGAWTLGPVWDIAPIHMLVLPNGKVMFYPGNTISGDDPRVWDPTTNTLTSLAKAGYDIFCSGHSFLRDGTILVTGGNLLTPFNGLPDASVYNPFTNIWTRLPDMNAARWYPSTTTMGNGDALVMTGTIDSTQMENPLPQIWQPGSGTWRNLTNAMLKIYNYSWVYATPSGKAFVAGPQPTTRYLDTSGTGSWSTLDTTNFPNTRDYGSSVMYGPYNILIAGGDQPPTNTAEIINLSDTTPTWQYTNPMAFPRRHMNMTLLPDDNVLVTGGTRADGFNDTSQPVYAAEMWNINTRAWTTMASQTMGRFYHSNALLLPDGRVLSAGGDGVFQAEIYSPPYLFKGPRPSITSAPASVRYGETFFVGTPDATNISKARLIRLPAVTHAFDMNQRLISVSFTQAAGGLNATAPASGNFAPPGHYMLFILNSTGVPSVAKIIQIDEGTGASGTINMSTVNLDSGFAYSTTQNFGTPGDASSAPTRSVLRIFENGIELGPPHSAHADIRTLGAGRFSHWDNGSGTVKLYFSASNNTNPKTNGRTYTYQVGSSTPTPPTAPTGLGATAVSSSAINLSWADQSTNETGFKIERALGAGAFSQIATVGTNVTTYANSGLTASTSYSYRVRATNSVGDSAYSNTASATTQASTPTAPAAPSSLGATAVSSSTINLSWADQSTNETGFKIERALGAGAFSQVATVGMNVTTYANSGLTASTSYSYRVRATNSVGDSAYSNTASATTQASAPAIPAAPTGLTATTVSRRQINLTWVDQANNEDGFKIERAQDAGSFSQIATVSPNIQTYVDTSVTPNKQYTYRVRAYNSGGNSAYSNTASDNTD